MKKLFVLIFVIFTYKAFLKADLNAGCSSEDTISIFYAARHGDFKEIEKFLNGNYFKKPISIAVSNDAGYNILHLISENINNRNAAASFSIFEKILNIIKQDAKSAQKLIDFLNSKNPHKETVFQINTRLIERLIPINKNNNQEYIYRVGICKKISTIISAELEKQLIPALPDLPTDLIKLILDYN